MSLTALDTEVKGSKCLIADYPDAIAKVRVLRDRIVDGSIKIADPMSAK
jgi:basic membrane protein A